MNAEQKLTAAQVEAERAEAKMIDALINFSATQDLTISQAKFIARTAMKFALAAIEPFKDKA